MGLFDWFKKNEVDKLMDSMVFVQGGTFEMGATKEMYAEAREDESPVHKVTLNSFYISKYVVTDGLKYYLEALKGHDFSYLHWKDRFPFPVCMMNENSCKYFMEELNRMVGGKFRMPTEAEWEYAARGGNRSCHYKYSGGNDLSEVGYFSSNAKKLCPVGQMKPNELGLYDMSGNVFEWCQDSYCRYGSEDQVNPVSSAKSDYYVLRGGCWFSEPYDCRITSRFPVPSYHNPLIEDAEWDGPISQGFGLRLVMDA